MKATCKQCKFFEEIRFKGGECRFNPPQLIEGYRAGWPGVQGNDWCGRFEQKNSTATEVRIGEPQIVGV